MIKKHNNKSEDIEKKKSPVTHISTRQIAAISARPRQTVMRSFRPLRKKSSVSCNIEMPSSANKTAPAPVFHTDHFCDNHFLTTLTSFLFFWFFYVQLGAVAYWFLKLIGYEIQKKLKIMENGHIWARQAGWVWLEIWISGLQTPTYSTCMRQDIADSIYSTKWLKYS